MGGPIVWIVCQLLSYDPPFIPVAFFVFCRSIIIWSLPCMVYINLHAGKVTHDKHVAKYQQSKKRER